MLAAAIAAFFYLRLAISCTRPRRAARAGRRRRSGGAGAGGGRRPPGRRRSRIVIPVGAGIALAICVVFTIVVGVVPSPVHRLRPRTPPSSSDGRRWRCAAVTAVERRSVVGGEPTSGAAPTWAVDRRRPRRRPHRRRARPIGRPGWRRRHRGLSGSLSSGTRNRPMTGSSQNDSARATAIADGQDVLGRVVEGVAGLPVAGRTWR